MIAPQSPTLQVFVPIEPVLGADVAPESLGPIATIEAYHVILMNGSPYRHGGNQNFLGRNGLSKLSDSSMDCGDQIRNLAGSDRMMPHVTPDDFRREVWINHFVVHGTIPIHFLEPSYSRRETLIPLVLRGADGAVR
jgi:hypothetical protein